MSFDYHRLGRVYPRLKLGEPYPRRPRRKPVYLFPPPVVAVLPPISVLIHKPKRAPERPFRKAKRAQVYLFPAPAPEFPVHLLKRPVPRRRPTEPKRLKRRFPVKLIPPPQLPDALLGRLRKRRRPAEEVARRRRRGFLVALIPAPAAPAFPEALFRRLRKKITPLPTRFKAPHRLDVALIPAPVVAPPFPEALFRRLPKRIPPLPVRLKAPHRLPVTLIPPPPPPPPFNVITVLKRKKRRVKDKRQRRRHRDLIAFLPDANWTFVLDDWPFVYTKAEWGKRTWKMEAYMRVDDTPAGTQTTKMRLFDTTLGVKVSGSGLQSSSATRERLISLALSLTDGSTYRVQRSDQLGDGFGKARLIAS